MCILSVFIGTNSKDALASSEANTQDMAGLHVSEFTDSLDSIIDPSPASMIIAWSAPSLSSFSSLLNSSLSSFSTSTKLAFSFLLLEPSRKCHVRQRLLSRFLRLVF